MHPAPVTETCRQVDGILVFHQPGFLHEALVLDVEAVLHQPVPEQTAHPQARLQQAEITDSESKDIQNRDRPVKEGEIQQPPVEKEQHRPGEECHTDSFPGNFSPLTPIVPRQEMASSRTTASLLQRIQLKIPVVRLKFNNILSTTSSVRFQW